MRDPDIDSESLLCGVEETNSAPHPPCWTAIAARPTLSTHTASCTVSPHTDLLQLALGTRETSRASFSAIHETILPSSKNLKHNSRHSLRFPFARSGEDLGGQKWPKVLGKAIADHDVLFLVWSKHAAASHFVEFEWCTAIALKKTIIRCLLDSTVMPPSLPQHKASSRPVFHAAWRPFTALGLWRILPRGP